MHIPVRPKHSNLILHSNHRRGLVALRMVSEVSKSDACSSEAPECALEILEASSDIAEIEAALSVIAAAGGGTRTEDALFYVQQQISRPVGLAALAALIPACDPKQLECCQDSLVDALRSRSSFIVSAAMKPAAALAVRHRVPSVRDAMAAAMLAFYSDEDVHISALQSLHGQVAAVPRDDRTLELIGFGLTAQLMRVNMTGTRAVRECAHALCTALGVLIAAPASVDEDDQSNDGSDSSSAGDLDVISE